MQAIRAVRGTRAASASPWPTSTGGWTSPRSGSALTDLTAADDRRPRSGWRSPRWRRPRGGPLVTRLLVVGMGRLGGRRGRATRSDADVLFVHDPLPGADEALAQEQASEVVRPAAASTSARRAPTRQLGIDADLRPEGKSGPLVRSRWPPTAPTTSDGRSSGSPRRCCERRRSPATPTSATRFVELVDPLRWPAAGLDRRAGARDPDPQGPDGGRTAARAEPNRAPTSSSARRPRPTSSGRSSSSSCSTRTATPACGPPRPSVRWRPRGKPVWSSQGSPTTWPPPGP